jgi:formate dehydrogenase subunit delta
LSNSQHLVQMANDIGNFFRAQPREDAITGIENHIRSYWTRRMCDKIFLELKRGGEGLDELPGEALRRLAEHPRFKADQTPGGDAG